MHKLGKLAPTRPDGVRDFISYAAKLPPAPKAVEYGGVRKPGSWGMDGNDTYGDCVAAGVAHLIVAFNGEVGQRDAVPSTSSIEHEYFLLTGGEDTGLVEADVLKTWHTQGLFGHRIAGYAPIRADAQLKQAIAFYGGAMLGVSLPESAEQQFDEGREWTVVQGSQNLGGHCIVAVGYDPLSVHCVTWGAEIRVSWPWIDKYMDEAWAVISSQDVEAGHGVTGLDLKALQADLKLV